MQENILRVVSNIFHLLLIDEYWSSLTGCWRKQCSRVRCTRWYSSGMIIFEYQNSTLLTIELDPRCYCSRWYSTTCSSAYTSFTSWTAILREQYSLSQLGHVDCYLSLLSCSSLWLWKAYFFMGQSSQIWHVLFARTNLTISPSTTHRNSSQLLDWKWLSLKRISQQYLAV